MERRLGRGLDALLGPEVADRPTDEVALDAIVPNPFQPRKAFDPSALEELRDSIRAHGVLQSILVRKVAAGFELISGERRCRAARMAGLRTIPAIVRTDVSDDRMLEFALVENVQRQDLDPIERAKGFKHLMQLRNLTQEQLADRVGLKRPSVANSIRLLELPSEVQVAVTDGRLSAGHARALLAAADDERILALATLVQAKSLSVRDTERLASAPSSVDGKPTRRPDGREAPAGPAWLDEMRRRIEESLGTKAEIRSSKEYQGQIILRFFDRKSLESLYERLAPKARV